MNDIAWYPTIPLSMLVELSAQGQIQSLLGILVDLNLIQVLEALLGLQSRPDQQLM